MARYFQPHIARMAGYTPGEQIEAAGVVKLNTNENPYAPSPAVARALATLRIESGDPGKAPISKGQSNRCLVGAA